MWRFPRNAPATSSFSLFFEMIHLLATAGDVTCTVQAIRDQPLKPALVARQDRKLTLPSVRMRTFWASPLQQEDMVQHHVQHSTKQIGPSNKEDMISLTISSSSEAPLALLVPFRFLFTFPHPMLPSPVPGALASLASQDPLPLGVHTNALLLGLAKASYNGCRGCLQLVVVQVHRPARPKLSR